MCLVGFRSRFWTLCLVFCGFAASQRVVFSDENEASPDDLARRFFLASQKIPERLLIRMKDIRNSTEFIEKFVHQTADAPGIGINSRRGGASGALGEFATCQTEMQTVQLTKPNNLAAMYWPQCVRVKRCGGCCTSEMLACQPVQKSQINITVMQLRYNVQAPDALESEGLRVLSLEQHDRCACRCKQQPEDCEPNVHEYRESECKCMCINHNEARLCRGPQKIWDSQDCLCKCRNARQCSTGYFFNVASCRCESINWRFGAIGSIEEARGCPSLQLVLEIFQVTKRDVLFVSRYCVVFDFIWCYYFDTIFI